MVRKAPQLPVRLVLELSADAGHPAPWPAIRRALKSLGRYYGLRNRAWVSRQDLDAAIRSGELIQIKPASNVTKD